MVHMKGRTWGNPHPCSAHYLRQHDAHGPRPIQRCYARVTPHVPCPVARLAGSGHRFCVTCLGEHVRVRLESYTLRHSSQQGRALRSFRVDASNASPPQADADWTALHTVVNDARLGVAEHSSASWDLLEPAAQAVGEAYRYFRVVKTGPDAQGDDFLHISGIELYGHVRMCLDMRDPCA